jgi:hypothetical protein
VIIRITDPATLDRFDKYLNTAEVSADSIKNHTELQTCISGLLSDRKVFDAWKLLFYWLRMRSSTDVATPSAIAAKRLSPQYWFDDLPVRRKNKRPIMKRSLVILACASL